MRRQLPTYVGVSEIPNAGYGLFSRYAIPKDRFIAEYVGEVRRISRPVWVIQWIVHGEDFVI